MRAALMRFRVLNATVAMRLGVMMSWPEWVPAILLGSMVGWYFHWTDILMLLLTIQTSADAAATKMLQNHVREEEERRDTSHDALLKRLDRNDKRIIKALNGAMLSVKANNELMEEILERGLKPRGNSRRRRDAAR